MQRFTIVLLVIFLTIYSIVAKHNKQKSSNKNETSIFTKEHRKFQNESLLIHNTLRARHCVPALVLDEEINKRAQAYAMYLAAKDSGLNHSTDRKDQFGENLYSVTRKKPITDLSAEKVVRTWYEEIKSYNYKKPGYSKNIGHFSQIVWKDTKRLGIGYATARSGRKMYVVAQYGPPGNYNFAYKKNVLEAKCEL